MLLFKVVKKYEYVLELDYNSNFKMYYLFIIVSCMDPTDLCI